MGPKMRTLATRTTTKSVNARSRRSVKKKNASTRNTEAAMKTRAMTLTDVVRESISERARAPNGAQANTRKEVATEKRAATGERAEGTEVGVVDMAVKSALATDRNRTARAELSRAMAVIHTAQVTVTVAVSNLLVMGAILTVPAAAIMVVRNNPTVARRALGTVVILMAVEAGVMVIRVSLMDVRMRAVMAVDVVMRMSMEREDSMVEGAMGGLVVMEEVMRGMVAGTRPSTYELDGHPDG